MTITQIKNQLQPGASFTFSAGSASTTLVVESNDGFTLIGRVVGGPRNGQQVNWGLEGLDEIHGIS